MPDPKTEKDVLVAVVRSSGSAMFHTQDCHHAARAMSPLAAKPDDFGPGDVACFHCLPDVPKEYRR